MDEYGTTAPGDPRPDVVVDFDEKIVEPVTSPKPVAWFIGRPDHRAVVVAVTRVFAPGQALVNEPCRQHGGRAAHSIRSPPQSQRAKPAARRPAIALTLIGLDAFLP